MKSDLAAKLKHILDNMSQEQFDSYWAEIKVLNLKGPTIEEYCSKLKFNKNMKSSPDVYTEDEVTKIFINKVRSIINYWHRDDSTSDVKDKLEGLAHSILCIIDGNTDLPKFILAPDPHPSDKEYHIKKGDKFFPENNESNINCDISGCLHELLFKNK